MLTIVAAIGRNNEIGKCNHLLWYLPKDLKHFRKITSGYPVIMGRKTYYSIKRPLPNRINIVITRNKAWFEKGIIVVNTLKEAFNYAKEYSKKTFIIGGGDIYKQCIDIVDRIELTRVDGEFDADIFFPHINEKEWKIVGQEFEPKDEKNKYNLCFQTLERKKARIL